VVLTVNLYGEILILVEWNPIQVLLRESQKWVVLDELAPDLVV